MNYFIAGMFTAIIIIWIYLYALLMLEITGTRNIKDLIKYIEFRLKAMGLLR